MNYDNMQNNKVYLCGKVKTELRFSHEVMGEGFYEFDLEVPRLSGQMDDIPVTISERIIEKGQLDVGKTVGIFGQMRSYNKQVGEKSKLILRVFAREIGIGDEDNPNYIELEGFVCKQPIYRTTPFGREICDLLIAVNRAYNKSDYIPAIAWGRNARYAADFKVGERILLCGRIQSRIYQKTLDDGSIEERVAYEVSISKIQTT